MGEGKKVESFNYQTEGCGYHMRWMKNTTTELKFLERKTSRERFSRMEREEEIKEWASGFPYPDICKYFKL